MNRSKASFGAACIVIAALSIGERDAQAHAQGRDALLNGAIGAGVGLGVDALLSRAPGPGHTPRRVSIAPIAWRNVAAVVVTWRR